MTVINKEMIIEIAKPLGVIWGIIATFILLVWFALNHPAIVVGVLLIGMPTMIAVGIGLDTYYNKQRYRK